MNERALPPLGSYRGFNVKFPAAEPEHVPQRPEWACRACGEDWPCVPAREQLLRQHESSPTSIAMLMWTYLENFVSDQGPGPLAGAFDRFIRWTRPPCQ